MGLLDRDVFLLRELQQQLTKENPRILTLGRLNNRLSKSCLKFVQSTYNLDASKHQYVDDVLRAIFQTEVVDTLDISPYQGCKIVHDLNFPLDTHSNEYDLVIDGGTIEHIFNIGVAFRNILELLTPQGAFYFSTMGNNHCGHGFYQISPEFFFSAEEHFGFKNTKVFLSPTLFPGQEIFQLPFFAEVRDNSRDSKRTVFHSFLPYGIAAYGVKDTASLKTGTWPVQSDYRAQITSTKYAQTERGNVRLFLSGLKQYVDRSIFNRSRFRIRRLRF